jgi:hypothetical protein
MRIFVFESKKYNHRAISDFELCTKKKNVLLAIVSFGFFQLFVFLPGISSLQSVYEIREKKKTKKKK